MILDKILGWAIPFICGSIAAGCITWMKAAQRKNSALERGVQCLLRAEIIRNDEKYTDRGYCPIYAKEALKNAYSAYHDLGGNDVATALYNETMSLKTDKGDESHAD